MAMVVTRGNVYTCDAEAIDRPSATVVSQGSIAICVDTGKTYINESGTWTQIDAAGVGSYTDEEAQDAVGTILTDTATIDFTYTDATPSITADVKNDSITYAKIQNVATDRLLGRDTALSGDIEELTVGGGIEFTGSGGIQTSALIGDVTKAAGGIATTIANDAVTYAKIQNVTDDRLIGRSAGSAGDAQEITVGSGLVLDSGALTLDPAITIAGGDWGYIETKASADSIDDEFNSGTLSAAWTVNSGASGTISLTETGVVEKYDLSTMPGWLMLQVGRTNGQTVEFKQSFTLADTKSIIVKIAYGASFNDGLGDFLLYLGDTTATTYVAVGIDSQSTSAAQPNFKVDAFSAGHTSAATGSYAAQPGYHWFRIMRDGLKYWCYWSNNGGRTWLFVGTATFAAALGYLYFRYGMWAAIGASSPAPICAVDWVRQGTNSYKPW